MRKFTFGYMGVLALFIIVGIGFVIFSNKDEAPPEIDENIKNKTPGLNTMVEIQNIIVQQQLQKYLMNIEVNPLKDGDQAIIELQGNQFVTEDILLKDSYNIFTSANAINGLNEATIQWYAKISQKNEMVLEITLTKEQLEKLKSNNYTSLPTLAKWYSKSEALK